MKDIEFVVFNDKSWVRLTEYQKLKQQIDKILTENTITFTCLNFNDRGTGFSKPMSIAQIDGKEVFLMLWSYLEGAEEIGKTRSVKYTIFQEK